MAARRLFKGVVLHYHRFRPHQGLGDAVLRETEQPSASKGVAASNEVVCHEWLVGPLNHCERKAAP